MSLQTGTELITLSLLLNKVSGIYGLLAFLTGLHLSPLQLSMYLYSLVALVVAGFLAPHIRRQSPRPCLALAWLYAIDSAISAAYTAAFGLTWFLVVSQAHSDARGSAPPRTGGGRTMDETAGFRSPGYNVSQVKLLHKPAAAPMGVDEVAAVGISGASTSASSPSLSHGFAMPESATSIAIILLLWLVRGYFILVIMAYARSLVRSQRRNSSLQAFDSKRISFGMGR